MIKRFDCKQYDPTAVGGKGFGLFKLVGYGLNVPDFFVIEANTDVNGEDFLRDLDENARLLNCERFAVRSSGANEDGATASYAGQFETKLNVTWDKLAQAVHDVCASANNLSAASYGKRLGNLSSGMAIVVQRQIDAIDAGVLFSSAPDEPDAVLIERVEGCGEGLVSGRVMPQTLRFNKTDAADGYLGELLNIAKTLDALEGPVDVEWCYDGQLWLVQLRKQTVLSDVIPPVLDRDWNMYVRHDFCPFCDSVQAQASLSYVQQAQYGFNIPVTEGLLVCGREFYSPQNDEIVGNTWASLDKDGFFEAFIDKINKTVSRVRRRTEQIKKRDFSALSDKALLKAYAKETAFYVSSYVPMMMRPDDYLYGKLVSSVGSVRAAEYVKAGTALLPKTDYSREREVFLRAVVNSDAESYLRLYEWKNNPLGKRISPVTKREFCSRAEGISAKQAQAVLTASAETKRKERLRARKLLADLQGDAARTVELIRRFTYLRTRVAESSDRYFYYVRSSLLREICKRFNLDDETLALYRFDEAARLFEGERLSLTQLTRRKSGEAIVFNGDDVKTYFGANAYALLSKLMPRLDSSRAVYGEIACRGEVTGKVKVVGSFKEAQIMEEGCILVTSMTTPDLSLALERAAGIITDEGGVTCHAAIIAREYAVPCLVGTRVATQVLSDGMTVRLDCVNGCFEILD